MDVQKLLSLLSREEGPKLDFKLKLNIEMESSKKELSKDISAIANARGGRGYILFGVEDKTKKLIGIKTSEFPEEQIQQIVSTRIDPPVPVSVDTLEVNKLTIGVITIYNTDQRPHQLRENGAFYTRRGSTTDIMRKEEIASMLQEAGLLNYELIPIMRALSYDLDVVKLEDFLSKSGLSSNYDENILVSSGILHRERDYNEYHPTCGGLLLFGSRPQDFIPHAVIKIFNNINKELPYHHISKGSIVSMLEDAANFIEKCLKSEDICLEIIEDTLGKAVLHRDYFDINRSIEVYISPEKIEIINPGSAKRDQNNSCNKYIRRNTWLYLKLLALDSKNRFFHKEVNPEIIIQRHGRIRYFNIPSKNLFKVVINLRRHKK